MTNRIVTWNFVNEKNYKNYFTRNWPGSKIKFLSYVVLNQTQLGYPHMILKPRREKILFSKALIASINQRRRRHNGLRRWLAMHLFLLAPLTNGTHKKNGGPRRTSLFLSLRDQRHFTLLLSRITCALIVDNLIPLLIHLKIVGIWIYIPTLSIVFFFLFLIIV